MKQIESRFGLHQTHNLRNTINPSNKSSPDQLKHKPYWKLKKASLPNPGSYQSTLVEQQNFPT